MKKRMLAFLLVCALILNTGTDISWAAEMTSAAVDDLLTAAASTSTSVLASGSCGTSATWTLDSDYCLTISGSGAMTDYTISSYSPGSHTYTGLNTPWADYLDQIKTIVVEQGITTIGACAFTGTYVAESVSLPTTLTRIGSDAFIGCSVTRLEIPEGVTYIGYYVFNYCEQLEYCYLPSTLLTLESSPFKECDNLSEIALGKQNTSFCLVDGILYDYAKTTVRACPTKKTGTVTIPSGVTTIDTYAFYQCEDLSVVNFPNTLTTIKNSAFLGCESLTSITIPSSVNTIENYIFEECENLNTVTFQSGSTLTRLSDSMFFACHNLTSINIPDSVTELGSAVFQWCYSLSSIDLPNRLTTIKHGAFIECKALKSIVLPDSVTSLGNSVFYDCPVLESVTLPAGLASIGTGTFNNCPMLQSIVIPAGVTSIGSKAFQACGLKSIYFQGDAPTIASDAFDSVTTDLTAYYPSGNTSWTSDMRQNYGADSITWSAYTPAETQPITTKVSSWNQSFTYDGTAHKASVPTVTGPSDYTIYYSTSQLTSANYSSGSTTVPSRTISGTSTIYYYVVPSSKAYTEASGSEQINIWPKVTVTAYSGTVDGSSHSVTTSVSGNATMYYSTSTSLTYSNYSSTGSTTKPTRSTEGTTTVYWIAVPTSGATDSSYTSGTSSITLTAAEAAKKTTTVTAADKSYAYDGTAHGFSLSVSGPSTYNVYYSTSQLTSANYPLGNTTAPTRTICGTSTVYYYVKSGDTAYTDASGSLKIHVYPTVSSSGATFTYDGNAHSVSLSVAAGSGSKLYYSTTTALSYSNYSSGSTTLPTRTVSGVVGVNYIAVPTSGTVTSYVTRQGTSYLYIKPKVSVTAYSGTVDGAAHTVATSVQGGATLYYSTSTALNSTNYAANGSTTKPTRSTAGTTTVYWIAVPDSDPVLPDTPSVSACVTGTSSITLSGASELSATQVSTADQTYTYDGAAHGFPMTVSGPASYKIYYSTSELNSGNYINGSTTAPTRILPGTSTIYYYVAPVNSSYAAVAGSVKIEILPSVSVKSYYGTADGEEHTINITGGTGCTIYYSISQVLTFGNYESYGMTSMPTRISEGTTDIYWIAVPKSGATTATCVNGSASITLTEEGDEQDRVNETTVECSDVTAAWDGSPHGLQIKVNGPSSYTIYYSKSPLTEDNYTSGSTKKPTRTAIGISVIYYYVKPAGDTWSAISGSASIRIDPAKVELVSAVSGNGYIKVTWVSQEDVDGYRVYRKHDNGSWSCIATLTGENTSTYTDNKSLTSGTTYTYTVKSYCGDQSGSYDKTGKSATAVILGKPALSSLKPGVGKLTLTWSKVSGAAGYYIYRKSGNAGSWSMVKKITSGSTVSWYDTSMKNGTKYTYTVRAFKNSVKSSYNTTGLTYYYLARPSYVKLSSTAKGSLSAVWAQITKVSGYQFYYSLSSTFKSDTRAKTISGASKTRYTITGLPGGKKYYVKARAFYKTGGKTYYSAWSPVASVTIKK